MFSGCHFDAFSCVSDGHNYKKVVKLHFDVQYIILKSTQLVYTDNVGRLVIWKTARNFKNVITIVPSKRKL